MVGNIKQNQYILDASFVLAFLLPDENSDDVKRAFNEFSTGLRSFYAPSLLVHEVLNGLAIAVLRKRITSQKASDLARVFLTWDIQYETTHFLSALTLALQEHITVYDATYALLSREKKMPLLSFDKRLIRLVGMPKRKGRSKN